MRLAFLLRRTEAELLDSLSSAGYTDCLAFAAEYDLPDEFFGSGQVCATTARVWGNDADRSDFVPYFRQPSPKGKTADQLRAKFAMMRHEVNSVKRAR